MTPQQHLEELNNRFKWVEDNIFGTWRILPSRGLVQGDCEDHVGTLLFNMAGRNPIRFVWWLVTLQAWFWLVKDPRGQPHAVLWTWWAGWTDCQKFEWTKGPGPHKLRLPVFWPVLFFMLWPIAWVERLYLKITGKG